MLLIPLAHGWVGWNNKNRPLTITFEFSQRQEFHSVTLTTYCQLDLGIQPFSQMLAYFSADGLTYHPQYVKVVNKEPTEPYQNITLSLTKRIGRFVKLEIYFDNKWILISEVKFQSQSTAKDMNQNIKDSIQTQRSGDGNLLLYDSDHDMLEETLSDTPAEHSELANVDDDIKQPTTSGKSNLRAKENKQVSGSVSCAKMKHY